MGRGSEAVWGWGGYILLFLNFYCIFYFYCIKQSTNVSVSLHLICRIISLNASVLKL